MTFPTKVCACEKFVPGERYVKGRDCPRCWNYYRVTNGLTEFKANPLPDCPYRGEPTGELIACGTCAASVKLKVFACSKNGRCTISRKAEGVAQCDGCR